jgi:eukaryotic-like serine/threonine-protein kinase
MGEVYRARDPRLGRDIALKVVRSSLAPDPAHMALLLREARAAGQLNHPNILAVFDVGTHEGVPYVVSELLQGQSLRERLVQGPVPFRKALEYGIEIARALGVAHESGIWHRDVKPGNVFVTTDGRVKLLDFGLATGHREGGHADPDEPTASDHDLGVVRGTAGYMSPEQVLGRPVDQRTDIFALGAVLYELFTGARAFQRSSDADARNAVLTAEPADPRELNPRLPDEAAAIVRRCLEKHKEERFQSARDLAFHLEQIHRTFEGSRSASTIRLGLGTERWTRWASFAAIAVGLALASVALALRTWPALFDLAGAPTFEQLTFRRGRVGGARFASNAQAVVYSEARPVYKDGRQQNQLEVWRIDLGDRPQPRSLGYLDADVLAAGPGDLALSLHSRFVGGRRFVGTLATVSSDTIPHEVAKNVEDADWDPAGASFAVARRTGAGGESALEYPVGQALYTTTGSIRSPRIARDGKRIAFFEDASGHGGGGRVVVVDMDRKRRELTPHWPNVRGLAWSPRGDEIWFSAAAAGRSDRALHAVGLTGQQRVVLEMPGSLSLWDIAPDGRVLVSRDEEWNALVGRAPGWAEERDVSWFDAAGIADLSDDGTTVLFGDRFGIYTRRTDGSAPVALGLKEGFADELSPDGQMVLATNATTSQLILLPTGAGESRLVPSYGIVSYKGATWCPDGRRIVFNGVEKGRDLRSYIQDVSDETPGPPRVLTPEGTWVLAVSSDGRWGAATEPRKGISLWPLDGGAPHDLPSSHPEDRPVAFSKDGQFLWVFRRGEIPAPVLRVDVRTGRREVWKTLWPPDPAGVYSIMNFNITPTGHAYFYSYAGTLSQLYLVRGLK